MEKTIVDRPGQDALARQVEGLASQIERGFLDVGGQLGIAVEAAGRILPQFEDLYDTLQAPDMDEAISTLHAVAQQLSVFGANPGKSGALLDELLGLTEGLINRIKRMHGALRGVDVLAINAKIAASHVRDLDQSMESFAGEIEKALKLFQGNLEVVAKKLAEVAGDLRQARREHQQFVKHRNETSPRIAESLHGTLELIDSRRQLAASVAGMVREKAGAISRDVSSAIMALQAGDATRQRLEHVAAGLAECHCLGLRDAEGEGRLATANAQLQARQLLAAAEDFGRNTAAIRQGLGELGEETGQIIALGQDAYSRGSYAGGNFLVGLSDEVLAVEQLLLSMRTAEVRAGQMVDRTLQSIEGLARYVRAIQLLETDIRVLALNTTLKCSRLGTAGLSLNVIAQELRSCSVSIAADAGAALRDLQDLVAASSAGAEATEGSSHEAFDALIARMEVSADRLSQGGHQLSQSLAALDTDGRAVSMAVAAASAIIDDQAAIARQISRSGDQLQAAWPACEDGAEVVARHGDFFARLRQTYTMEQERAIFDAFAGTPGAGGAGFMDAALLGTPAPATPEPADIDLDDFLF